MKAIKRTAAMLLLALAFLFTATTVAAAELDGSNSEVYVPADNGNEASGDNGDVADNDSTNGDNATQPPNGNGDNNEALWHLENRIRELEAQLATLSALLNAAPVVDHAAISLQRQEAADLERYMLRLSYYGVTMTIAHNNLLARQRTLLERQLHLENVRLELGFTTQRNIDELSAMLNGLSRQIQLNNETIQIQRRHIETRRGRHGYEFIGDFGIPSPSSPSAGSADELRDSLIRNNVALFILESHLSQAHRHSATWNEVSLLQEQRDLLIRQLEMAAIISWDAYLHARAQHNLAVSERPLLQSRLRLIDEMFSLGEISEVDKMTLRFAVYAELHNAEATTVALAMAVAEVDFMMRGIVGG